MQNTILATILIAGCATPLQAQRSRTRVVVQSTGGGTGSSPQWIGGSPVQTKVYVGQDGETYVGVWIDAPDAPAGQTQRMPMAVSLVIDSSGSMAGEKMANARIAAMGLLESLVDGDQVSIYGFNNGVFEIAPPTQVSGASRGQLMQRVQYLSAAGGTNLWDGLATGINRVAAAPATHTVRRIVLISDGHANIGPSDPNSLGNLAAQGTEHSIQISAIGVGLGYDENLLGRLAINSSGRLYHLEAPHQMASILDREMRLLASTVATDAFIEVIPAPGVTILGGLTPGIRLDNNRIHMPVGSVYAGQRREVLFRARVNTNAPGNQALATARLHYRAADRRQAQQEVPLVYEVTRNQQEARRSAAPRVQAMVATHEVAQAQQQAAVALNRGDRATAERHFQFAEESIQRAERAAPQMSRSTRRRLRRTATRHRAARTRAATAMSASAARGAALDVAAESYSNSGY